MARVAALLAAMAFVSGTALGGGTEDSASVSSRCGAGG
jgi:hypothetical protein